MFEFGPRLTFQQPGCGQRRQHPLSRRAAAAGRRQTMISIGARASPGSPSRRRLLPLTSSPAGRPWTVPHAADRRSSLPAKRRHPSALPPHTSTLPTLAVFLPSLLDSVLRTRSPQKLMQGAGGGDGGSAVRAATKGGVEREDEGGSEGGRKSGRATANPRKGRGGRENETPGASRQRGRRSCGSVKTNAWREFTQCGFPGNVTGLQIAKSTTRQMEG